MSKICGYSCEHNKSGVCQISVCDKKIIMSDKTEVQTFTRYLDPTITKLQQENKHLDEVNCKLRKTNEQLKDNWNKLKEFIKSQNDGGIFSNLMIISDALNKMQELEQGSDNNDSN